MLLQKEALTSTPRSLVSPAPHSIGQALDVGWANAVVSRVTGEDYFSSILIVRTVDDPPFPMVQREGAETRAHNDCVPKKRWGVGIVSFRLFKWIYFCFNFLSYLLYTHC